MIQQIANISILPTLTLNDQIRLEEEVATSLDVSTLVVPIGGVGVYPTMVMETTDLRWTLDTIAHEWTHNYLNLRPLGLNYSTTPELRTMNETTASIVGGEVGTYVLQKYYPEILPARSAPISNFISFNETFLPRRRWTSLLPLTFAPRCTKRVLPPIRCLSRERPNKQKHTWNNDGRSFGKMDICSAS